MPTTRSWPSHTGSSTTAIVARIENPLEPEDQVGQVGNRAMPILEVKRGTRTPSSPCASLAMRPTSATEQDVSGALGVWHKTEDIAIGIGDTGDGVLRATKCWHADGTIEARSVARSLVRSRHGAVLS
jgi:hypothetical protein